MTNTALVTVHDGEVLTTSAEIATAFEKQHKHVLHAIDKLVALLPEEHRPNFRPMFAKVKIGQGALRQSRTYSVTRDGFSLLAMGFTGAKALDWKVKFLDAFNAMEAALRTAANDDQAPNLMKLGSPQDLARLQTALVCIREARFIFGANRAAHVWEQIGLPVPPEEKQMTLPALPESGEGPLWMWASAVGLVKSVSMQISLEDLHEKYRLWCGLRGFDVASIEQFERGLRLTYGESKYPRFYNVKTTRN